MAEITISLLLLGTRPAAGRLGGGSVLLETRRMLEDCGFQEEQENASKEEPGLVTRGTKRSLFRDIERGHDPVAYLLL